MIISRRVITGKVEVTKGTDSNPTPAADAIRVENPQFAWAEARMYDPQSTKPSKGSEKSEFGGALGQLTFDVVMRGSGAAGTPPEYGALLRACGFGETIVASTSVTYDLVSENEESASVYYYDDGKLRKLLGCHGDIAWAAEVGQPLRASFTMTGHVVDEADVALPAPTFDQAAPPVYLGAAFSVDSYAAKISALNFALGNEIAMPGDVSTVDGFGDLEIVDRLVAGSLDPLDAVVATYDWVAKWKAADTVALLSGAFGATAGNIINVSIPFLQYKELTDADRNKLKSLEVGFEGKESAGDDELSIAFT
jgi:hypothetical protein